MEVADDGLEHRLRRLRVADHSSRILGSLADPLQKVGSWRPHYTQLAIRETSAKPSMNQSPRPCMIPTIQRLPERLKMSAKNKPMANIAANIHK
jgi:hypothetical protein